MAPLRWNSDLARTPPAHSPSPDPSSSTESLIYVEPPQPVEPQSPILKIVSDGPVQYAHPFRPISPNISPDTEHIENVDRPSRSHSPSQHSIAEHIAYAESSTRSWSSISSPTSEHVEYVEPDFADLPLFMEVIYETAYRPLLRSLSSPRPLFYCSNRPISWKDLGALVENPSSALTRVSPGRGVPEHWTPPPTVEVTPLRPQDDQPIRSACVTQVWNPPSTVEAVPFGTRTITKDKIVLGEKPPLSSNHDGAYSCARRAIPRVGHSVREANWCRRRK